MDRGCSWRRQLLFLQQRTIHMSHWIHLVRTLQSAQQKAASTLPASSLHQTTGQSWVQLCRSTLQVCPARKNLHQLFPSTGRLRSKKNTYTFRPSACREVKNEKIHDLRHQGRTDVRPSWASGLLSGGDHSICIWILPHLH